MKKKTKKRTTQVQISLMTEQDWDWEEVIRMIEEEIRLHGYCTKVKIKQVR